MQSLFSLTCKNQFLEWFLSFWVIDLCFNLWKCVVDQWCNQGIGGEEPWIRSRAGAGGPTGRNGGARGMWWRGISTVSATCTEAATVQESLWKTPRPPPPPPTAVVKPSRLISPILGKEWPVVVAAAAPLTSHLQRHLLAPRIFTSIRGIQFLNHLRISWIDNP